MSKKSVVVAQLGARNHYITARSLYWAGILKKLYTDMCANKGVGNFANLIPRKLMPKTLYRLKNRIPLDIPVDLITTFDWIGINYYLENFLLKNTSIREEAHYRASKRFNANIIKHGLEDVSTLYNFSNEGLDLTKYASNLGIWTILEQTGIPAKKTNDILAQEFDRYPGWSKVSFESMKYSSEWIDRCSEEWKYANTIVCASQYTKQALIDCGVPNNKCVVVPYGFDYGNSAVTKVAHDKLRVLVVGRVSLLKGAPYVLEIAKILSGEAIVRMVGEIEVSDDAVKILRPWVHIVGPVSRGHISEHFNWADVLLFPTLTDGFGIVILEAFAAGIPVIATTNSAAPDVIRHGIDGFITEPRDINGMVHCLSLLSGNPQLLKDMSLSVKKRISEFSLESYQKKLLPIIR